MDNEITTLSEAPITITRTFKLGDYKNLKVNVTPNKLDSETMWKMLVENACDAYAQLFTHQLVTAKLYDGDTDFWVAKLNKLIEIKQELLQSWEE